MNASKFMALGSYIPKPIGLIIFLLQISYIFY